MPLPLPIPAMSPTFEKTTVTEPLPACAGKLVAATAERARANAIGFGRMVILGGKGVRRAFARGYCIIAAAIFSADIRTGKLVLAPGTTGKIEASTTRRP